MLIETLTNFKEKPLLLQVKSFTPAAIAGKSNAYPTSISTKIGSGEHLELSESNFKALVVLMGKRRSYFMLNETVVMVRGLLSPEALKFFACKPHRKIIKSHGKRPSQHASCVENSCGIYANSCIGDEMIRDTYASRLDCSYLR